MKVFQNFVHNSQSEIDEEFIYFKHPRKISSNQMIEVNSIVNSIDNKYELELMKLLLK